MPVRMQHPKHGYTHAYNTVDKAYLESLGWRVEEAKPVEPKVEITPEDEDAAIRQAYFNKFGKKPHHMLKIENILKALNGDS